MNQAIGKTPRLKILTSRDFSFSPPLIIDEAKKHGFDVTVYADRNLPIPAILLDCDVFIDFSSITNINFYKALKIEFDKLVNKNIKLPIMIDPPSAVIKAMDKRKTHELFPDLVPESYNLDGVNNESLISNFNGDEYVVIKDPFGWQSEGVERLSPSKATEKYKNARNLIVQKYLNAKSVGRILTLNSNSGFEIICAYLRIPKSWKTEEDGYKCEQVNINGKMIDFAKTVSEKCGLYLNGIDYIFNRGKYILLEVNAAPGLKEPFDEFGINTTKILFDHIEKDLHLNS